MFVKLAALHVHISECHKVTKKSLEAAMRAKNDEFYTQLPDIESELSNYKRHFRGKVVYCNCDDPRISNFFRYFSYNFDHLKIKRLVTTCYKNQMPDLFSRHDVERAIMLDYNGYRNGEVTPRIDDIDITTLNGDGDFRSAECIELLKRADIVVTNPPFSMFREYVSQLILHGKKFIIIGTKNAIGYKEIFPLIKDNVMWLGVTPMGRDMLFDVPQHYANELRATRREGSAYKIIDGVVKGRVTATWFTNLDHHKRHENMILYKKYSSKEYPKYDNWDAIEVCKTEDIPADYSGVMGVPITFLSKYNPDQFEIVGITKTWFGEATKTYPPHTQVSASNQYNDVVTLNAAPALRIDGPINKTYYIVDGKYYRAAYARILIRNRRVDS